MSINPRRVVLGNNAKEKLVRGINILADAVKTTLGPKGQNVIIQREFGPPQVTKDGVTVAREIFLEDLLEDTGARLIKQAAGQTADDIGDGTTTATVLAQAMIKEGLKFQAAGIRGINIKRGIDKAIDIALDELSKISKPCNDAGTIKSVATISAKLKESIRPISIKNQEHMDSVPMKELTKNEGVSDWRMSIYSGRYPNTSKEEIKNYKNNEIDNLSKTKKYKTREKY
jgi:chaperonin GroEL (HSP60 family)